MSPSISSRTLAACALVASLGFWLRDSCSLCSLLCLSSSPDAISAHQAKHTCSDCLEGGFGIKPHQASWGSWYHAEVNSYEIGIDRRQRAGAVTKDWNILYHLGGNGPWVEKTVDVAKGGIGVPKDCEVEQIHMMARHAERYPTRRVAQRIKMLVQRMRDSGVVFQDELSFFTDWTLFWSDDSQIEQLTSTGPFSGTLGSFTTGVRLRTRYHRLLSIAQSRFPKIKFWASDSQRVIDTARYFGAGFFGLDWQNTTTLEVISEDPSLGADTLTPGDTCLTYVNDEDEGHDKGYAMLWRYRTTYLGAIRARLLEHNPDFHFTEDEIYAMQEMCGFEITIRGRSHWCDVFTTEDFLSFEYARDLLHYYRAGPGTKYGAVMGWLWLNATMNLMLDGPDAGHMFFSFVHDGDIAPMIAALDIITDDEHLPITHIQHDRKWRKSQVSPMGGRTIFEVLSCEATTGIKGSSKYVRININDGITAIPGCDTGPGRSCPLEVFAARTRRKGDEVGDFRQKCGLGEDAADRITFLHQ